MILPGVIITYLLIAGIITWGGKEYGDVEEEVKKWYYNAERDVLVSPSEDIVVNMNIEAQPHVSIRYEIKGPCDHFH